MRRRGQWSECPLNLRTAVLDVPLTVDVAVGLNWAEAH
jgi:DNA polymerase I-like protein with 3'-5' exonuclease and polymerase domains